MSIVAVSLQDHLVHPVCLPAQLLEPLVSVPHPLPNFRVINDCLVHSGQVLEELVLALSTEHSLNPCRLYCSVQRDLCVHVTKAGARNIAGVQAGYSVQVSSVLYLLRNHSEVCKESNLCSAASLLQECCPFLVQTHLQMTHDLVNLLTTLHARPLYGQTTSQSGILNLTPLLMTQIQTTHPLLEILLIPRLLHFGQSVHLKL